MSRNGQGIDKVCDLAYRPGARESERRDHGTYRRRDMRNALAHALRPLRCSGRRFVHTLRRSARLSRFLQCDHCTPLVNKEEHTRLCVSALRYTADTGVLIKTYKDKGEQRLSETLAAILANALPPSWLRWANGVTYVSATKAARRRRGFDHMELLARSLAGQCGLPCIRALNPPTARDQRILDRAERKQNMQGRFTACEPLPGRRLILIDDVFTTGATMDQASIALERAGAQVRCATVARA